MTADARLLLTAALAVVALIVLIARAKVHPFIALVCVSLAMGVASGMKALDAASAFQTGVGNVLGFIAVVVGLGTMLGKLMAESGGATQIANTLIERFGARRVHWAIMLVAFIVGIPMFYQVGFVLLIPLVFTIARRTSVPLLAIGMSFTAGLSVVHGLLPPHPAAMLAVSAYKADLGLTIFYGLIVGLPTAALAGPIYGLWIAKRVALPARNPMAAQLEGESLRAIQANSAHEPEGSHPPTFAASLFTVLVPVILMLVASIADLTLDPASRVRTGAHFIGHPIVALLLALLFSFWSLARPRRFTRSDIVRFCNDCLGPTATILLVIGAGGGFNQVLVQSGVGTAIAHVAGDTHTSPLLLAWGIAGLIRVATGSATVSMTTAAGIVAPIAATTPGANAELLVLATGAGSLILSHVNDAGFWLVKEFFNMTVPQTLRSWTVVETIIGVAGLIFTLLLSVAV